MSRVFIENSSLQDIADAIRIKNGSSDDYYPSEMAQAIEDIPTGNMHDYLRFIAIENSTVSITSAVAVNFEYSTDMVTWNTWTYTESGSTRTFTTVNINAGNCIYVRGDNTYLGVSSKYTTFRMSGKIAAYGNIMYLLSKSGNITSLNGKNYCFAYLFSGCSSIVRAPKLPAITLSDYCYYSMFYGCTSLIEAPELPATTLKNRCYTTMFSGCTSLRKAPELQALSLTTACYQNMFLNCSNLNYIKVLATTWNTSYTYGFSNGVSTYGVFIKPTNTSIATGTTGIPSGWTVIDI